MPGYMTQLPTNRTAASSIAEHTSDHNTLHGQHNELDGHAADTAAHDLDATIAAAIDALVAAAPGTLDTLNELAAALGDDADFAATITTALAGKSATGHGHAESDVTSLVSDLAGKAATGHNHTGTYEPSGTVATHEADTTSVHGITDTSALETTTGSAAKVAAHEADTTSVHGIADTSALSLTSHTHGGTYEPVATAHHARHEPGGADALAVDAAAATGSLRTLGTAATQAAAGNDARLSDARTPSGTAGGVLSGTYPNPGFAADMATQAELDAEAAARAAADALKVNGTVRLSVQTSAPSSPTTNDLWLDSDATSTLEHTHTGAYVPLSTVDAAGDLLVGTANDTVDRLALGTALYVLRVNAAGTALEYAAAAAGGSDATFNRFAFR